MESESAEAVDISLPDREPGFGAVAGMLKTRGSDVVVDLFVTIWESSVKST